MLYHLLTPLREFWFGFNIFRYITVRCALAAATAFLLSIVLGPIVIRWLRGRRIQEVGEKGDSRRLDALHRTKRSTPTMGGLLVVGVTLFSTILWARPEVLAVLVVLGVTVSLGAIGFIDDSLKLSQRNGHGLGARRKLGSQVAIGLAAGFLLYDGLDVVPPPGPEASRPGLLQVLQATEAPTPERVAPIACPAPPVLAVSTVPPATTPESGPSSGPRRRIENGLARPQAVVWLPFSKGHHLALGALFVLFAALVIAGASNAVNLTDGLDGLAVGTLLPVSLTLLIAAYAVGREDFSAYLLVPHVPGAGEVAIFCAAIIGAGMGFLWFNCHPAEVFLGDTGALPLGGALGAVALVTKQEAILLVAGGVFVAEALSVMIQVASFRLTGRRVFRIAPLHHHFEFLGWPESKITVRFWIVGIALGMAALVTLKAR